jgi:hypothetical protein
MSDRSIGTRNVVFISKATPGDDEFVLWLAPRLEAEGYAVYADTRVEREWCQREVLVAKRNGMPVVILDALGYAEERGF